MHIKITKCSIPGAWYADRVGWTFQVSRFEKKHSDSQGIPSDVYWCREGGVYNCLNYVLVSDAEEVNLSDEALACPCGCVSFHVLRDGNLECSRCQARHQRQGNGWVCLG